jgi:hypothetical protein
LHTTKKEKKRKDVRLFYSSSTGGNQNIIFVEAVANINDFGLN